MRKLVTVRHLVIHHSESPGGGVAFIRHVHVAEFGWADIGYHYVIGNGIGWGGYAALADGATAPGRDSIYQGAHCRGHNADSIGICVIGALHQNDPTPAQVAALVKILTALCRRYHLSHTAIVGHRDLLATTCPGDRMYALLPTVREAVRAHLATEVVQ